jgi:hypothetical protein
MALISLSYLSLAQEPWPMSSRSPRLLAIILLAAATSGCVRQIEESGVRHFTYETWLPLVLLVGGIVAAPAGWHLRKSAGRIGWALLIGGPIAALMFAPSMYRDRVTVSADSFAMRTGIWGMSSVHDVNFADVNQMRLIVEESRGRRGRKKLNYYLISEKKDGTVDKAPVNNGVSEAAFPFILEAAAARGVPIVDETGAAGG